MRGGPRSLDGWRRVSAAAALYLYLWCLPSVADPLTIPVWTIQVWWSNSITCLLTFLHPGGGLATRATARHSKSWAGLGWVRPSWAGLSLAVLGWARLGWIALCWAELVWAVLGWVELGWVELGWAELVWAVLSWAELGWAGLGWAGLGWAVLQGLALHHSHWFL